MRSAALKTLLLAVVVTLCVTGRPDKDDSTDSSLEEEEDSETTLNCSNDICEKQECVTTASRILESLDTSVEPCDNFYDFACGGWEKEQIIPSEKYSLLTLYDADKHLAAVKRLLESEVQPSDLSPVRKAKELYTSCTKYAAKSKKDKSVVKIIKSRFGTWPLTVKDWDDSDFDLEAFLTEALHLGVSPLIKLHVGLSAYINSGKVIFHHLLLLSKPSFGLPLGAYLSSSEDDLTLQIYSNKIYADAQRFGIEDSETAKEEIQELVEVEKTLAQMAYYLGTENQVNYTLSEMDEYFGEVMNWTHFVTSALTSPKVGITDLTDADNVTVNEQEYMINMTAYFSELPSRTQANYIIWRVLDSLESVLITAHSKIDSLLKKTVQGITADPSPEESCINYVSKAFDLVLHRLLYTDKFPPEEMATVYSILKELQQEFDVILDEHDWVDDETAKVIKEKNAALATTLLFYEQSMDDSLLENFYANVTVFVKHFTKSVILEREESVVRNLRLMRKPYVRTLEELPHEMVAQNFFLDNRMEFTSIIFEPPTFISHVPMSLNYGSFGMVVGHEIIHAFDNTGYTFNKEGVQGQWWSNETVAIFQERQQCLIDQFSKFYYTEAGDFVDGNLTLPENMGDNGGIKLAYRAYKKYAKSIGKEEQRLPGVDFTHDQLFFINFAQIWCKIEKKESAEYTLRDPHSPHRFRVIGTAQNSKYFARAFNCPKDSYMNPETKCEVW